MRIRMKMSEQRLPSHYFRDKFRFIYRKDCEKVMDTLVSPMRFLQMDDVEFVLMKACILFNPVAKGLSNESVMKVLDTRRKIFASLENYTKNKMPKDPNRLGDLTFFILSPLQSLAKSISEDVLVAKLSGVARIDQLMEELILEDSEPKDNGSQMQRSFSETDDRQHKQQPNSPITCRLTSVSPSSAPATSSIVSAMASETRPASSSLSAGSSDNMQNRIVVTSVNGTNVNSFAANGTVRSSPKETDMFSTLTSYVFGSTIQGPLSPSNDVFLCSTSVPSVPADIKPSFPNVQQMSPVTSPAMPWPNATSTLNNFTYCPTKY
jgi:hypothetical protein